MDNGTACFLVRVVHLHGAAWRVLNSLSDCHRVAAVLLAAADKLTAGLMHRFLAQWREEPFVVVKITVERVKVRKFFFEFFSTGTCTGLVVSCSAPFGWNSALPLYTDLRYASNVGAHSAAAWLQVLYRYRKKGDDALEHALLGGGVKCASAAIRCCGAVIPQHACHARHSDRGLWVCSLSGRPTSQRLW